MPLWPSKGTHGRPSTGSTAAPGENHISTRMRFGSSGATSKFSNTLAQRTQTVLGQQDARCTRRQGPGSVPEDHVGQVIELPALAQQRFALRTDDIRQALRTSQQTTKQWA